MGKIILNDKRFQDLINLEILSIFNKEIKFPIGTTLPVSFAQGDNYKLDHIKLIGLREIQIIPVTKHTWNNYKVDSRIRETLNFKLTKKQYDYFKYLCI